MSSAVNVNPVEIARIALKRLTERGMPPTPENYTQFYNAIVTIKSPETKTPDDLQHAWELLYQVDELVGNATDTTMHLLDALLVGREAMESNLGALRRVKQAHSEQLHSPAEAHSALEDLLNQIISSTQDVHSTVSTSHADLQTIRDSILHIEEDLSFSRKMMEQDVLTGALNRQCLDHILLREVKRAQRGDGRLSSVLFDLDDLNQVCDRFGYATGDLMLVHVANPTKAVLRDSDLLIRYTPTEFLLLLPETDLAGSKYVVDRLKLVAGNTPFIHNNQRIEVRFSAGGAALKTDENGRAMVLRAEEALYRAKHSGHGKVEMSD